MVDARSWAWFGGGVVSGLGLCGLYHWKYRGKNALGRIYRVGDRFFADSAVVEELLRRVPGSERLSTSGARIYLYRRGTLTFESEGSGQLPGQVGPHVLRMFAHGTDVEDLAIELIRFGLARHGGAFTTWPVEGPRGTWTPPPEPLHPSAFDPRRQAWVAVAPLRDPPPRPIGHYFQVGQNYYADENFLRTLEGFHGADFVRGRVVVPFWRRGSLELFEQTTARMMPEQVGALHRIEPHLTRDNLADLLIEIEGLGLISWGGAWPRFPERLAGYVPTGPLTAKSSGRVFEDGGRYYIDETARRNLLSRLPHGPSDVVWRGQGFRFHEAVIAARDDHGALYTVTPESGPPEGELAHAFVEELVLHRIATRASFHTARPKLAGHGAGSAVLRLAAERLVDTLPRPDLAPVRVVTRRHRVAPGTLVVLPLHPAEAAVLAPEDRYGLALRLPDGRGFMFSFQEFAPPSATDLQHNMWDWDDEGDPDDEAVELAHGLGWADVADVLDLDLVDVERSVHND